MWYWIFRGLFIVIAKVLFRLKVEGLENLPQKTNFIIAANHFSFLDTVVIGAAIPRRVYWIATRHLYKVGLLKWFFQLIDAVPSGNSSQKAIDLLSRNKNIGLFPEGKLSRDGKLGEFRSGAAMLALKTGRPILPCAIIGTYSALPPGTYFPKFVPVKIRIGKPSFLLREFGDMMDDVYMQEGITKIKKSIEEMLYAE